VVGNFSGWTSPRDCMGGNPTRDVSANTRRRTRTRVVARKTLILVLRIRQIGILEAKTVYQNPTFLYLPYKVRIVHPHTADQSAICKIVLVHERAHEAHIQLLSLRCVHRTGYFFCSATAGSTTSASIAGKSTPDAISRRRASTNFSLSSSTLSMAIVWSCSTLKCWGISCAITAM
jgi:hypothetical protein